MKFPIWMAAVAALHNLPAWADTYSFAGVKDAGISAQDLAARQYDYTDATLRADAQLASASGRGNFATAQTSLGVNRIAVSNTQAVSDEFIRDTGIGGPFAIALSGWSDDLTIHGGTGQGKALISVQVSGMFGPGFGSGGGYGLWVGTPQGMRTEITEYLATDPTAWIAETIDEPTDGTETLLISYLANVLKPGHNDPGLSLPPGSKFGGQFVAELTFTYGESFSIASVLYGSANDDGSLWAMNSAHFGISILGNSNAQIGSRAGAVYAAAVPEPAGVALGMAGLLSLLTLRRPQPA